MVQRTKQVTSGLVLRPEGNMVKPQEAESELPAGLPRIPPLKSAASGRNNSKSATESADM